VIAVLEKNLVAADDRKRMLLTIHREKLRISNIATRANGSHRNNPEVAHHGLYQSYSSLLISPNRIKTRRDTCQLDSVEHQVFKKR
jgi:hypothetical protein